MAKMKSKPSCFETDKILIKNLSGFSIQPLEFFCIKYFYENNLQRKM